MKRIYHNTGNEKYRIWKKRISYFTYSAITLSCITGFVMGLINGKFNKAFLGFSVFFVLFILYKAGKDISVKNTKVPDEDEEPEEYADFFQA